MFHRSYGETRNCKGCKYWSEMIARSIGGGAVEALCLSEKSTNQGRYTTAIVTCESFTPGLDGAIDQPGGYNEPSEFWCDICGKETKTLSGLKSHYGRMHKNVEDPCDECYERGFHDELCSKSTMPI